MAKLQFKSGRLDPRWKLPVGSYSLNRALGGGLESGRIHTFWGAKSSTKSTNGLYAVANAQQMGKKCAYIDAEKTYSPDYAESCGVNIDKLLFLDEGTNIAEDLLTLLLPLMDNKELDVIVIDSLSSVLQGSFFDKPESNPMGIYARSAKFVLAKLLNSLSRSQQIILISHASMDLSGHIPMLTAAMGNAQAHWVSNVIQFSANNGKTNFRDDGFRKVTWKIGKSKQPVWPLNGEFYHHSNGKVDTIAEIADLAKELDIVTGSTWLTYGDRKFHGNDALLAEMREEPLLLREINTAIREYDETYRSGLVKTVDDSELEE